MSNDRPDPDALLARVKAEEATRQRGRLKIFFGMAPGVGKTYAMLEAARKAAKEGADLVVGYLEPHARPETHALLMGLDLLPRKSLEYRGRTVEEFDLEGALQRKPEILLVDELAHTNAPGATHPKRWQDVEDLLAAGISVYTTINVQHLESVNDIIAQVTSIPVRETVPDHIFEGADEVELIDISPEDLIERLREGKVYVTEQAARAIESFFRKGNLIALRELALRKTAERVGAQAIDYRQAHDVARIWPTSDRLLVCVGPSPMSARLIRAARRMASSLHAPWIALHVELDGPHRDHPGDLQRLEANLRLAEELGATVATVSGNSFATSVIDYARQKNVTRIIAGKPLHPRWLDWWRGSFVSELIRESGDIDVYVISGDATDPPRPRPRPLQAITDHSRTSTRGYGMSLVAVACCTLISYLLAPFFEPTNLAMVYLAGVVTVALTHGRGPSIIATILGVATFDLLFIAPFGTFAVRDSQYLLTFAIMLLTGLVISELVARVRSHSQRQHDRERRTAALYALSKELAILPTREAVIEKSRRMIQQALDVDVWIINPDECLRLGMPDTTTANAPPASDVGVIRWVFDHNRPAGRGTDTLPGTTTTYLPLSVTSGLVGVLGVRPHSPELPLGIAQRDLLNAFAGQVAGALERCGLAEVAEQTRLMMETERLRNSLLSTVSHDLRTPLATITGAASALADPAHLDASQQRDLAESIVDESDRLNRLVTNLLDLTRLEANAIQLRKELQPIDEVVGITLSRMERPLRDHQLVSTIEDDLPPIAIDELLMPQVLVNLLDNAVKYSPAGSAIELHCRREDRNLILEVSDRGPGLPEGEEQKIFEKFHRVEGPNRSSRGSGIGLAICRGIVELHGGTITARNRPGGGAVFRISLPIGNDSVSAEMNR
jgi:two-component system sensor histidine kinase KdpD